MRIFALALALLAIGGCVQFPEIDDATGRVAKTAEYPQLISLEPLADVLNGADTETLETEDELDARVSRLKARADRLRGPVLDTDDRARLDKTPQ